MSAVSSSTDSLILEHVPVRWYFSDLQVKRISDGVLAFVGQTQDDDYGFIYFKDERGNPLHEVPVEKKGWVVDTSTPTGKLMALLFFVENQFRKSRQSSSAKDLSAKFKRRCDEAATAVYEASCTMNPDIAKCEELQVIQRFWFTAYGVMNMHTLSLVHSEYPENLWVELNELCSENSKNFSPPLPCGVRVTIESVLEELRFLVTNFERP
jgi:hypothetical protein